MTDEGGEFEDIREENAAASNFSAGEVLRLTFSVFGKNPVLYFGLAFLASVPGILIKSFLSRSAVASVPNIVSAFFSVIFTGAIAYGVYKGLIGERSSFGEAVSRGLSQWFPLIGLTVLLGVLVTPFLLLGVVFRWFGIISTAVVIVYCLCVYAVVTPACVVERLGVVRSLSRSAALTQGHLGSVLGLLLLNILVATLISLLLGFIFSFSAAGLSIVKKIINPFITALTQVGIAVLYYQLRATKEGVSVSKLARIFE